MLPRRSTLHQDAGALADVVGGRRAMLAAGLGHATGRPDPALQGAAAIAAGCPAAVRSPQPTRCRAVGALAETPARGRTGCFKRSLSVCSVSLRRTRRQRYVRRLPDDLIAGIGIGVDHVHRPVKYLLSHLPMQICFVTQLHQRTTTMRHQAAHLELEVLGQYRRLRAGVD